jgi:hypothetical protein
MNFKEFYQIYSEQNENDTINVISRLFKELAEKQRFGGPENMFQSNVNPGIDYSSIFQWAAEHTGDLIHRASYPPKGTVMGGGIGYGFGAVREKVKKLHRMAKEWRDYEASTHKNPFLDSLKNDYDYTKKSGDTNLSFEEYQKEFVDASKRYSDSYRALPAYTEMQRLGRQAAVALGKLDIKWYYIFLSELLELIEKGESSYFIPSKVLKGNDLDLSEHLTKLENYVKENNNDLDSLSGVTDL